MPVLSLSAALMATSSPPGRTFAIFSGMATLFETTTSCPNSGPLHDADWPSLNNPPVMLVGELTQTPAWPAMEVVFAKLAKRLGDRVRNPMTFGLMSTCHMTHTAPHVGEPIYHIDHYAEGASFSEDRSDFYCSSIRRKR